MTDRAGDVGSRWDYEALSSPIDVEALRLYQAEVARSPEGIRARRRLIVAIPTFVVMVLVGAASAAVIVGLLASIILVPDLMTKVFALVGVVVFALVIRFCLDIVRRDARGLVPWRRWYRLHRFAAANRMSFAPEVIAPPLAGLIFTTGDDRTAFDVIGSNEGRAIEIGNYRYVGELGPKRVLAWGYIAIQLDRRLPHLVMESRQNRRTNLPAVFPRTQTLSLEGNFDNHFTLFAPREYRPDALYVFTPDLMALLIDNASALDIEIVDDWLFLYSHKPFDMLDQGPYALVERIVRTIGAKSIRQTAMYADTRVGDYSANVVGHTGRRLTQRLSPVFILAFVVIALMVVGVLASLVALLFRAQ